MQKQNLFQHRNIHGVLLAYESPPKVPCRRAWKLRWPSSQALKAQILGISDAQGYSRFSQGRFVTCLYVLGYCSFYIHIHGLMRHLSYTSIYSHKLTAWMSLKCTKPKLPAIQKVQGASRHTYATRAEHVRYDNREDARPTTSAPASVEHPYSHRGHPPP